MRAAGRRPKMKASARASVIPSGAIVCGPALAGRLKPAHTPSAAIERALATSAAKFTRMQQGNRRQKSECQIGDRVCATKVSALGFWKRRHGYDTPGTMTTRV